MNRRMLKKKIQHDRPSYKRLLRQAKTHGSRALCRRDRAMRRLSRQICRERHRKIVICEETLSQLAAYEPKNEEERQEVLFWQKKVRASLKPLKEEEERVERIEQAARGFRKALKESEWIMSAVRRKVQDACC